MLEPASYWFEQRRYMKSCAIATLFVTTLVLIAFVAS